MVSENLIIRCDKCGAKNRVPADRLKDGPICGKCGSHLSITEKCDRPVVVTDQTFHKEVLGFQGAVLVDCWAPWCGPCKMLAPVLDELAMEYAGRVKIAKLNTDENPITGSRYSVRSIPTLLLFRNGDLINTLVGALPKGEIKRHLAAIA